MTALPTGTVTFLFTDIEGSTALWERDRSAMAIAVERHLALLDEAITVHRGVHFKTVGDAIQAAFPTASAALAAAIAGQQAILGEPWPEEIGSLRVRMALHVGTAEPDAGDYVAMGLNRLSRMLGAGYGGQILVSEAIRRLVADEVPADVTLSSVGLHTLRDLQAPEEIFQVVAPGLPERFPDLRSLPHHGTNLVAPLTRPRTSIRGGSFAPLPQYAWHGRHHQSARPRSFPGPSPPRPAARPRSRFLVPRPLFWCDGKAARGSMRGLCVAIRRPQFAEIILMMCEQGYYDHARLVLSRD